MAWTISDFTNQSRGLVVNADGSINVALAAAITGTVGIDQITANANEVVTKTGSVTAATLSAETTKVIGTVNIAAAQTLANVTTVAAVTAITNALPAGANLMGDVGISGARTSGGSTPYKNLDVDESEDEVKGTAGQVYWMHVVNLSAAKLYLKFYNATAANVTVGTTVPVLTLPIPTLATTNGCGFVLAIPNGIAFGTAITIAATTGFADNDAGAPGANEVIVNLGYA